MSNLEGAALKLVVAKKKEEKDTAEKICDILWNRFCSGMKGLQVSIRFNERNERPPGQAPRCNLQ